MQSLNEELHTVNAELEERNRALLEAADDLQNLLNSTEIATVFLDANLAIKRFTTPARNVFSLIGSDVGRPISDLSANLRYDRLLDDAREVLETLAFRERQIQTKEGSWRQMRIMPYRTHDNAIDGVVLTFVDIDQLKRTEQIAQASRAFAEEVIESLSQGLVLLGDDLQVLSANRAFCSMFRTDPSYVLGMPIDRVFEGSLGLAEIGARLRDVLAVQGSSDTARIETAIPRSDGMQHLVFSARWMKAEVGRLARLILTIEQTVPN
jgi:two-component system CheB/CheR fusion protein